MELLKQYRWAIFTVFMLLVTVPAVAQTLTTDAPTQNKIYEIVLKVIFPLVWTAGAPWFTALVTKGINNVPTQVKVLISSVAAAVVAGIAGAIPDFPVTIESAMEMAAGQGAAGQLLAQSRDPNQIVAKPAVVPPATGG